MVFAKTVMIVDDDPDVLASTSEVVRSFGYNVITERDGRRAALLYQEVKPDIVITDFMLPNMDGYETFKAIRKASPNAKVIFLTGFPESPKLKNVISEGAVYCLKKPMEGVVLKELLGHA